MIVRDMSPEIQTYEGWNIGAVSVKRVVLLPDDSLRFDIRKHNGDPDKTVRELLDGRRDTPSGVVVTGPEASTTFTLPYLPESLCIEAALKHLKLNTDMVLSLGGETFIVYCISDGMVRSMLSSNRCAAGSGEFLVQQFGRMNLSLEEGIRVAKEGKRVSMASRCSVHCKSDATHKLNKGECSPADIAFSLIAELAGKIARLAISANWPRQNILLAGGLTLNEVLVSELRALLPETNMGTLPESAYFESFGAAVAAREKGPQKLAVPDDWLGQKAALSF
ncbi:MAG: BadF/BadG/BcrA/BcrD ATPase family protein, partial [Dehalococcoidales bacterium]|nr:BadF/BadG/BcrA/BcrD ATPase family protein [Dehalococcoidales bacterium]